MARKFKLLQGRHQERGGEGVTYKPGQVVESKDDLVKIFGSDKFKELPADAQASTPAVDPRRDIGKQQLEDAGPENPAPNLDPNKDDEDKGTDDNGASGLGEDEESALGKDVTGSFEDAQPNGLKVFHDGKHYSVTDATDTATAINEKDELTSKQKTAKFIGDFVSK